MEVNIVQKQVVLEGLLPEFAPSRSLLKVGPSPVILVL